MAWFQVSCISQNWEWMHNFWRVFVQKNIFEWLVYGENSIWIYVNWIICILKPIIIVFMPFHVCLIGLQLPPNCPLNTWKLIYKCCVNEDTNRYETELWLYYKLIIILNWWKIIVLFSFKLLKLFFRLWIDWS